MTDQHYHPMLKINPYLILFLLLMNCNSKPEIEAQGHRGCRGLLPENTLPAFKKAIELGVHTLELDLAVSKDGIVVVSHEPYMNATICHKPDGGDIFESEAKAFNLYQLTFEEIQAFDCGSKAHPRFPGQQLMEVSKPSLSQVFELAEALDPKIKYNIEIKSHPDYDNIFTPAPQEFVRLVIEEIDKHNVFKRTNLQSFDLRVLEEIKRQAPNMPVAVLIEEDEAIWPKTTSLSFSPEIISPYFKLLDAETVRNLKAENFQVIPWTVNDIKDMQQMIDFGVDAIITDYPDRLIPLLKK
ncbi:glycerophosphodiester phosphodiesterase [Paucihalobacter sp.]|uniref:glycerophosphodiester phosphodiesterase n=1 Tax=Paucihalobacter sp. TaxID=2850405 RepID=UPI003D161BA9